MAPDRTVPSPNIPWPSGLVDTGAISQSDLLSAQQHSRREGVELVDGLISLGLLSEADAYARLAAAAGTTVVDLTTTPSSELALRLVPQRLARRHLIVPLSVDNRTITYATCKPLDPEAERDLSFAAGRRSHIVVAPRAAVLAALDRCYPRQRELDLLAARLSSERSSVESIEHSADAAASDSTVVTLCNHLVGRAVEVGASDIHVECGSSGTSVRYRICGVLEPVLTLPAAVSQLLRNRYKIMAKADIAVHHRPQDGAFRIAVGGRPIDVRLSTLPTVDGEKIVMRVIDSHSPLHGLDRLGYDDDTMTRLRARLARPDGLVLVTGPTGSGKTTALYAALAHLCTGRTNVVSVEDPVERSVAGVTQIPVNSRGGNSFATVLRAMLRQDPNVIMVGEIRDEEVAQIVGQAAYTGHLVLSSMHTADAATAVTRLRNLGLEPYKIAESLSAVLAQRLLRTLCTHCRVPRTDAAPGGVPAGATTYAAGAGCAHCKQTGYGGRVPVAELLTPSNELRDAISRGATAYEIRAAMRSSGSPTMRDRGLELVAKGVTSIDEVNRVLADDAPTSITRDKARVLVADDDPISRMLVKVLLEKEQFEVLQATNGAEAVEIATREHPDLLLIDLQMPKMDGYEVIARLRRDLSMATLPIVVITAEDGPGIEQRVLELGADDYIVKPFDPAILQSRVNAVFRRIQAAA